MFPTLFRKLVEWFVFDALVGQYSERFDREGESISRSIGPVAGYVYYCYVLDADTFRLELHTKQVRVEYGVTIGEDVTSQGATAWCMPDWAWKIRDRLVNLALCKPTVPF